MASDAPHLPLVRAPASEASGAKAPVTSAPAARAAAGRGTRLSSRELADRATAVGHRQRAGYVAGVTALGFVVVGLALVATVALSAEGQEAVGGYVWIGGSCGGGAAGLYGIRVLLRKVGPAIYMALGVAALGELGSLFVLARTVAGTWGGGDLTYGLVKALGMVVLAGCFGLLLNHTIRNLMGGGPMRMPEA